MAGRVSLLIAGRAALWAVLAVACVAPAQGGDSAATRGDRWDGGINEGPKVVTVGSSLKAVLAAAANRDWPTAQAKLVDAHAVANPTDIDRFEIDVVTAYVALNTGDYSTALASYRKVITSPFFRSAQSGKEQQFTLKNAMILSNQAGDFTTAVTYGEMLAERDALDEVSANALAVAYFGNKDYAKAHAMATRAIDLANGSGRPADPSAIQILAKTKTYLH